MLNWLSVLEGNFKWSTFKPWEVSFKSPEGFSWKCRRSGNTGPLFQTGTNWLKLRIVCFIYMECSPIWHGFHHAFFSHTSLLLHLLYLSSLCAYLSLKSFIWANISKGTGISPRLQGKCSSRAGSRNMPFMFFCPTHTCLHKCELIQSRNTRFICDFYARLYKWPQESSLKCSGSVQMTPE